MISVHKNIHNAIIAKLQMASQSIKINVPWFTSKELFSALLDAAMRGVEIKLVIEDDEINHNTRINHRELLNNNGKLYWHKKLTGVNHEKYCLIDDDFFIYGSFNWTFTAINHNLESIIIIEKAVDGADMIEQFVEHFNNTLKSPNITPEIGVERCTETAMVDTSSMLKAQLFLLESECVILQEQVSEISGVYESITNFINLSLFESILRKLELNQKLAGHNAERTRKKIYNEQFNNFENELNRWKNWKESVLAEKNIKVELYKDDKLKQLYYKASRLAHPDKFIDDPKKHMKATEIMQAINQAYNFNDFEKMEEIIVDLETGYAFDKTYQHIHNTSLLQRILNQLENSKQTLSGKLEELKENEFFAIYCLQIDKESYLEKIKMKLEQDIQILENNLIQITNG